MASTSRGAFFGNVVDPQPAILSKKMNSVANIFQLVCVHFRSTSFKTDVKKKKSNNFEIYRMLYCYSFSAVTARFFEWLVDGKSSKKTKLNHLINSVCFRVPSIAKKEQHGNYSMKIHSQMYSTWYMKVHSEE